MQIRTLLLLATSSLLGCTSDKIVEVRNSIPSISIESHVDGDTVFVGEVIELKAQVTDNNNTADELEVEWMAGERVACSYIAPDAGGLSVCATSLEIGEEEIKATVRDPSNATSTAGVTVLLYDSEPPVAQIISPSSEGVFYADELIRFEGLVSDDEDEPALLQINWESSIQGTLELDTAPDADGSFSDFGYLESGEHGLSLIVEDSSGKVTSEDIVITVKDTNTAPDCAITAPPDGSSGGEGELVVFQGEASDLDIPASDLSVVFSSNIDGELGSVTPTSEGIVEFPYSNLTSGSHLISMTVTDEVDGECVANVVYTIGSAPIITVDEPTTGSTYNENEVITFSATITDVDDAPADLIVSWVSDLDGEFSTSGPNSNGVAQFTYGALTSGIHNITITATDPTGLYSDALLSLTINGAPSQPDVTITPDPAYTDDDLTAAATGSVDPDGSGVSYSYEWLLNGSSMNTGPILSSSNTAKGQTWTVRATPSDGSTTGQYGEANVTITNSAPSVDAVVLSPTAPTTQESVQCSYTVSDADGDSLDVTYSWSIDGQSQSESSDTLNGPFVEGNELTCTVTADDGDDVSINSASVFVTNSAPVIASITLNPTSIYTQDILEAVVSASDPEGDPITYTFEWFVNGSSVQVDTQTAVNASIYGEDHFVRDDTVYVAVTADDGSTTTTDTSATLTVLNTPPSAHSPIITPSEPTSGVDDLVCSASYDAVDVDLDPVTLNFAWEVDGQATNYTTDTVPGGDTNSDEEWTCIITPNDGTDDGASITVSITIDSSTEGTQGYTFCASGGTVSNSNYDMTFCLSPVGVGVGEASNSNYTLQMGPIYRFVPN